MKGLAPRTVLITGGAGFVGSNLAERLLQSPNTHVRIFDDLSRRGVEQNLAWLLRLPGGDRLDFERGDIRNAAAVCKAVTDVTEIYHLASQVAVTTSVEEPWNDFEINAAGTVNVLEAARRSGRDPYILFTSTNKVYGSLESVPVHVDGARYRAQGASFAGVTEAAPLDFHSPYGCSKGAADQYVRDYARIYGLRTTVFRMSCIAGPRQFGTEDQGWLAHFVYSVLEHKTITIYGDGFQVRDILHVHDLVDAIEAANRSADRTAGQIYNLGGGPERSISVLEMLETISRETGVEPTLRYSDVRPGDQPLYISNTAKLEGDTGWRACRSLRETLQAICQFWRENRAAITLQRSAVAPSDHASVDLVGQEVA